MKPRAILFDFDGVLIDSEWAGNSFMADYLTKAGHPTRPEDAIENFMGLAGDAFEQAIHDWTDGNPPDGFREARLQRGMAYLRDGIAEVSGASAFIRALPADFPIAVASSATTRWLTGHLDHLGLRDRFGEHVYSGRDHVQRMKPAPDIYLFAADRLGIPIADTLIVEDSPVGIEGAVASGAQVVGLLAGSHCRDGHEARLIGAGAPACVRSFDELAARFL
ncbi:HAD family phosphatase [Sphingomonas sabuli]|uniref:HAD family phosphatase n=1 Tax=Sphingomonas sabuli TaxID=2764186 RepID=A0A7G9L0D5_9SPHN|nr:HAD family phosphatase [Sphingomonas sabuli]QNM82084.1 HAD family phosphatase [Sphingomonas sabuli]